MNTLRRIFTLFLVSLFGMLSHSQASATTLPMQVEGAPTLEVAPEGETTQIILIIIRKGKYAEVQGIKQFSSDGGLGGTRIAAEAKIRDNHFLIIFPKGGAASLFGVEGVRINKPLRLSSKLSSQLGYEGALTLKAGTFTDMNEVQEKRMLWFEIQ